MRRERERERFGRANTFVWENKNIKRTIMRFYYFSRLIDSLSQFDWLTCMINLGVDWFRICSREIFMRFLLLLLFFSIIYELLLLMNRTYSIIGVIVLSFFLLDAFLACWKRERENQLLFFNIYLLKNFYLFSFI